MSDDIKEAIAYSDKCWEKVNKKYYKFQDALIHYRQTLTAKNRSDMWYLGYMLAGQKFQGDSDSKEVGIETILDAIRDGYEESKLINGGQK
jgi:hypothetical protein